MRGHSLCRPPDSMTCLPLLHLFLFLARTSLHTRLKVVKVKGCGGVAGRTVGKCVANGLSLKAGREHEELVSVI